VKRRANWLDILSRALAVGAETGGCPALDPREAANLPRLQARSSAEAALRTPRAVVVAQYEETALRLVWEGSKTVIHTVSVIYRNSVIRCTGRNTALRLDKNSCLCTSIVWKRNL
jgi:hypothetical protein